MNESVESAYYAFMGFDPDNARRVLRFYTQFFPKGPVLELACGPGIFLSLLGADNVEARGVDIDDGMVRTAREAGNDVVLGDAVDHLSSLPEDSLHGLFAAHFLEHLPAPTVQRLYLEAHRVLAPGGTFVAVVPNAACLSVLGRDFWRDPTHVRFYDPLALQFFARQAGFAITASGGNPFNQPGPPPDLRPPPVATLPSLHESARRAVQRAIALHPDHADAPAEPDQVTDAQVWAEVGNVLATFDERVQTLQHDLHRLHACYSNLIRQLYPANEVYVAAVVRDQPETEPAHIEGKS